EYLDPEETRRKVLEVRSYDRSPEQIHKDLTAYFERQREQDVRSATGVLALAFALAGDRTAAREYLEKLSVQVTQSKFDMASVYMALGEFGRALPLLESGRAELQSWKSDMQQNNQEMALWTPLWASCGNVCTAGL